MNLVRRENRIIDHLTPKEALAQLKALGDDKLRAQTIKRGAPENQFGVKHGDIRALARGGAWRVECVGAAPLVTVC